jgi:hypothetical protein
MKRLILAGVALAMLAVGVPAQAHSAATFYGGAKWNSRQFVNVYIYSGGTGGTGWWSANAIDSLQIALQAWNGISGNGPEYFYQGFHAGVPCGVGPMVMVSHDPINQTDLGITDGGTYVQCFPTVFVYVASNLPGPDTWSRKCVDTDANVHSLCGVLAHEFGHVSGQVTGGDGNGHFIDAAACPGPNDGANNTMCQNWNVANEYRMSHLNAHDAHTFQNAYP